MGLLENLMGQLGGDTMKQIGRSLGTDEKKAGEATSAALTTLFGALGRNASDSQGAEALNRALEKDHDDSLLDNLGSFLQKPDRGEGQGILRHVLGGKRNRVERSLGQAAGVQSGQMGQLLEMLAPVVMSALAKEKKQQGFDATGLAKQLGQERQMLEQGSPAGGVLSGLLDTDGDGDVDAGDLLKHGRGLLGKFLGGR